MSALLPSAIRTGTLAALAMLASGCGSGGASAPVTTTQQPATGTADLSAYYLTPALCTDGSGPDCTKLRLGDTHFTTSGPAVGKLFSCVGANANAPGSIRSKITWIDDVTSSWNLLRKPFLPAASASTTPGTLGLTEAGGTRTIVASSYPVDAKVGNWPMTQYALLTAIDPNPGTPAAHTVTFTLPMSPVAAATPTCVALGAIGITLNGVVLYNAADARGNDAAAHEIVDVYGGHPAMSDYHYHFVPERLEPARLADGHSGIIGYIRDGFAIYGYRGVGGGEVSNADLDECHGHAHGSLGYHYHATIEYPYTVGCYRGTPR